MDDCQGRRKPDAVALTVGGRSLQYRELELLSNRFGRLLLDTGCKRGDRISLFLNNSVHTVVSLLGIIKIGAVIIPLSPKVAPAKFQRILQNDNVSWIIADTDLPRPLTLIQEVHQEKGNRLGFGWLGPEDEVRNLHIHPEFVMSNLAHYSGELLPAFAIDSDPVYIDYRQNGSDRTEGEIFSQKALKECVLGIIEGLGIHEEDRVCCTVPLHFSCSCFDMLAALAAGASLEVVPNQVIGIPGLLLRQMITCEVTHLIVLPAIMEYPGMEKALSANVFPRLRSLIVRGQSGNDLPKNKRAGSVGQINAVNTGETHLPRPQVYYKQKMYARSG